MSSKTNNKRPKSLFNKMKNYFCVCKKSSSDPNKLYSSPKPISFPIPKSTLIIQNIFPLPIDLAAQNPLPSKNLNKISKVRIKTKVLISSIEVFFVFLTSFY